MKLCSKMSRPDAPDLKNMKRVGRFRGGRTRVGCLFEWQAHPSALHAFAEACWAGDRQLRQSVGGSMILHGKHLVKARTTQQSSVATSTAEEELYPGNRAAAESMGVQAFAKTWVESSRFGCTSTVCNQQNRVGQSEAHRDSAPVAPASSNERTCCVREPVGECHPLAMITGQGGTMRGGRRK